LNIGLDFITVFQPQVFLLISIGVMGGILIGALPGLTATMSVALLIPMTFGMPPVLGLSMLMGIYVGGIYGGSIAAILIRTPGTPSSAATVLDGYPLAQKGQAGKALGMATIASFIGGIFSAIVLILLAPQLAKIALEFGPPEYFAMALFGLTIISSVSGNALKGLIAGTVGMLLSTIGADPISGANRFTFDSMNLTSGIAFIPALIGLFAISEAMLQIEKMKKEVVDTQKVSGLFPSLQEFKMCARTFLRGSILGTFIGIVPGTGAGIASWVTYNETKRASKTPEKFGTGHIEGIAATESANNAVTGGALVPLLTLGIPGDTVTAVLLGGLMIQGLAPGPMLFSKHPDVIAGLFAAIIVANFCMLIYGLIGVKLFAKVLNIPKKVLIPTIVILCFVGTYSINMSVFDLGVMLVFGVIGYFMQKYDFSPAAMCIALILGPIAEQNFRLGLIMSDGSPSIFFTSPISAVLIVLAVLSMLLPVIKKKKLQKQEGELTRV